MRIRLRQLDWRLWIDDLVVHQVAQLVPAPDSTRYLARHFIQAGHLGVASGEGFDRYPAPAFEQPGFIDARDHPQRSRAKRQGDQSRRSAASLKPRHSRQSKERQVAAIVKRRAELFVNQLRSRARRAPFATSVQSQVLIKGVDIDQTLNIAEHELERGRFASVLTLWGVRDQVYTGAQAQRVSYLYFQYIDTRKDYFDVWHFTWAVSNIYRNGNAAVRAELELAYQDSQKRAKAAGGWADGLANRDVLMGDIHPPARHFVQTHVVAPGNPRYLQSSEDCETSRSISHTAHATLSEPSDGIDLEAWLFGLSDADYQTCAKGHRGAGVFSDDQGRGMINVESIGGNLIVQHYRSVRAESGAMEMYSPASRVYLFHLVPVTAGVRWTLAVTPGAAGGSKLACTVQVDLRPVLGVLARLTLLGHFLGRHVEEEAAGFAADIARKHVTRSAALDRAAS